MRSFNYFLNLHQIIPGIRGGLPAEAAQSMSRVAAFLGLVLGCVIFARVQAAEQTDPLEDLFVLSEEAQQLLAPAAAPAAMPQDLPFAVSAEFAGGLAVFSFKIAPGAYIYKDSLKAEAPGSGTEFSLRPLPEAVPHQDALGEREVYFGDLQVEVLILDSGAGAVLKLAYQGCDARGICYPPAAQSLELPEYHRQLTRLEDAPAGAGAGDGSAGQAGPAGAAAPSLWSAAGMAEHFFLALALCLLLGAGLDLTPCVLPLLAVYSAMIMGSGKKSFRGALVLNSAYLAGLVLVYAALGLVIASAGVAAHAWLQHPLVTGVTAVLFILLALNCAGVYGFSGFGRLNAAIQQRLAAQQRGRPGSAFMFGALSALLSTPCTSAPLAGALLYILQSGNAAGGTLMFMAIGLGMGLPLFFIGIFGTRFLPKSGPGGELVKRLMAVPLVYAAYAVSSARLGDAAWLVQILVLSLCAAYVIWCLAGFWDRGTSWQRLLAGAGVFAGCVCAGLQLSSPPRAPEFAQLGSCAELEAYRGRPVVVTFSAAWCSNCHAMDAQLYASDEYKAMTAGLAGVRFDLTDPDTEAGKELCEKFGVVGVPYLVVLDGAGEVKGSLAGYAGIEEVRGLLEGAGVLQRP